MLHVEISGKQPNPKVTARRVEQSNRSILRMFRSETQQGAGAVCGKIFWHAIGD